VSGRLQLRRYQLGKGALRVVRSGHPWVFRQHMSSAAQGFADGQWLRLVDGANRIVGYGMYQTGGALAIRVLRRGPARPDAAWVGRQVDAALARRALLRAETDAFRAVHGESDGLPAVTVDVYGPTAVLQTYAMGADALGRLVAAHVRCRLGLASVCWKPASRRRDDGGSASGRLRALWGQTPEEIQVREGDLPLWVDVLRGQKSGAFLDLRGLRRWVRGRSLSGRRVLNLFAYTGWLARAAEAAGAREVWSVDIAPAALEFAQRRVVGDPASHRFLVADVFEWIAAVPQEQVFDLVVVDPPPMASRMQQVPRALAAYRRLYRNVARHVASGGLVAACCCTSRIEVAELRATVAAGLGPGFRLVERIPAEPDHPVEFAEADYLKILIYAGP
jgi:23S rRNA (cytosine1962-C5)-methyltransferase